MKYSDRFTYLSDVLVSEKLDSFPSSLFWQSSINQEDMHAWFHRGSMRNGKNVKTLKLSLFWPQRG